MLAHRNKGVEKRVESADPRETGRVRHRDRTRPVFVSVAVFSEETGHVWNQDQTCPVFDPKANDLVIDDQTLTCVRSMAI